MSEIPIQHAIRRNAAFLALSPRRVGAHPETDCVLDEDRSNLHDRVGALPTTVTTSVVPRPTLQAIGDDTVDHDEVDCGALAILRNHATLGADDVRHVHVVVAAGDA